MQYIRVHWIQKNRKIFFYALPCKCPPKHAMPHNNRSLAGESDSDPGNQDQVFALTHQMPFLHSRIRQI